MTFEGPRKIGHDDRRWKLPIKLICAFFRVLHAHHITRYVATGVNDFILYNFILPREVMKHIIHNQAGIRPSSDLFFGAYKCMALLSQSQIYNDVDCEEKRNEEHKYTQLLWRIDVVLSACAGRSQYIIMFYCYIHFFSGKSIVPRTRYIIGIITAYTYDNVFCFPCQTSDTRILLLNNKIWCNIWNHIIYSWTPL